MTAFSATVTRWSQCTEKPLQSFGAWHTGFILGSQQRLVLIGKVLKRSLPLTAGFFFSFLDNVDEEEDERSLEV